MPYFPFNMFPYSNIHNLNLDWMLAVMQELTRKITEYEGSATPYDQAPLMDGAASPGDSPNYARGNHRHPTDSSKFDKTGGTITGILDVAPRRVWAYLATPGWYRVLSFESNIANDVMGAAGMQIDLFINRSGVDNEAHKITLDLIYNPMFIDEVSKSNNNLITKVRYTRTTTGAKQYGYVDIYYAGSAQNTVLVDFAAHTASPAVMEKVNAAALQYVAASPASETVVTEKSLFPNNIMADVSNMISWNSDYVADASGIKVYLDRNKLFFVGALIMVDNIDLKGLIIATLDSKIAVVANSELNSTFNNDVADVNSFNYPTVLYTYSPTQIRFANESSNAANHVGIPTTRNRLRINCMLPLQ